MIAYATFAHHDPGLLQAVSTKVLHMPGMFDSQAIANTLWALAVLDNLSPAVWNCLLVVFVQAEKFNREFAIFICSCNKQDFDEQCTRLDRGWLKHCFNDVLDEQLPTSAGNSSPTL